jgi:prepilin-type N-terminal cleavage/methylation domain-containing protein
VASKIHSSAAGRRDRGFTLIEMLIVLTVMGTLTAVISSVIIVALRSTPSAEARVDDARGVQSLVTWLAVRGFGPERELQRALGPVE